MKLTFSLGKNNAKLRKLEEKTGKTVYSFSLLSGHSCPYSKECNSSAVSTPEGRRIQDGLHTKFRCFSASQEVLFTNVYKQRKANMEILQIAARDRDKATKYLLSALPNDADIVRIHVAGDFATKAYFQSWLQVAVERRDVQFYAYTKSLPFWADALQRNEIPPNFLLTASRGGWKDNLIEECGLRFAEVVFSEGEARKKRLIIDHDDSHAALKRHKGQNFALLLHGVQPKESVAAAALKKIKSIRRLSLTGD